MQNGTPERPRRGIVVVYESITLWEVSEMNRRMVIGMLGVTVVVLLGVSGCGRVKEATQLAKSVAGMAEAGRQAAETANAAEESSVDWENYDLKESDVRRFYQAVAVLEDEHPDIGFEVAMTAALGAMSEGLNLENVVEEETELSFEEYSGLSTALMVVQGEAAGLRFTEEMVASMEDGLSQFDDTDPSELTEEQRAALDQQRQALSEAKAEMESAEFQARKQKVEMVTAIRREMGF